MRKITPHVVGAVVYRIGVHRGEHLGRHLVLHLVQDLELVALRQRCGSSELASLEEAADARILPIEQILVRPFEIESEVEGLPHAAVLELRAPQIEHEALHRLRALDRHFLALDQSVAHCGEIVGRRPVLGATLLVIVEIACLEAFEGDRLVAIIVEADLVEIPLAAIDRQILAPIVGHALIS